jgi:hypothetical protein
MQEFNLNCGKDERDLILGKLKRMFSSSNINVLIGSAFSLPYLKTLKDIEKRLSAAIESGNRTEEFKVKEEFFNQSIAPVIGIDVNESSFAEKRQFIKTLADIISLRETSMVHKIINIFTTNYDNILETAMEMNHIDYFDGFSGRISPKFSTANYGKLICRQTELTGRISESVSCNLFKMHGSLYWKQDGEDIVFEDFSGKITEISLETEEDEFLKKYSQLCIINPEKNKFNSTVMNSNYYDQLRMFANELERQNTIMIAFGFSFADEHIMQVVKRALSSNPTLTLLLFPYCEDDLESFAEVFRFNNNVFCYYCREDSETEIQAFDLQNMNDLLLEIYHGVK